MRADNVLKSLYEALGREFGLVESYRLTFGGVAAPGADSVQYVCDCQREAAGKVHPLAGHGQRVERMSFIWLRKVALVGAPARDRMAADAANIMREDLGTFHVGQCPECGRVHVMAGQ